MSNYTKSTNFATKDALASGNALKIVKGTEIDTEFNNIATAVATKADLASPTFTGTVTIPTLAVTSTMAVTGTSTLTGVATLTAQPILSSLTASKPVFTDASKGLVSTGILGADQGGSGVANNASMTVTGSGNFAYTRTLTATTNVTFPTTGTLSTLAGSETFTNKTLTSPVISGTPTGVGVLSSGTAVNTTSGTSVTFSSIPSWVKRITLSFAGVSLSAGSVPLLQIGDSSIKTTGYLGSASSQNGDTTNLTTGFLVVAPAIGSAGRLWQGTVTLTLLDSATNKWVATAKAGTSNSVDGSEMGGYNTLTAALAELKLTTVSGTDTFTAGAVNILFE